MLAGLLCDTSWWVRYRAAQALARLPGLSPGELRALAEGLGDRYAADMVAQVLAEQEAS